MPLRCSATEAAASPLGEAFVHAIACRDFAKVTQLLHQDVEFRALTPRRSWDPATREDAVAVLRTWFGDCDIQEVLHVDTVDLGGRHSLAYRYQGERYDAPFIIEQHAYYDEVDGQIGWIRVLCSGFRPR
jgi:hypothetical protein